MGKRKITQRNTLAQWVGVAGPHEEAIPQGIGHSILTFRIDGTRLRQHQCKHVSSESLPLTLAISETLSTESDDEIFLSTTANFATASPSDHGKAAREAAEKAEQKPQVEAHPFFSIAKRKAPGGQSQRAGSSTTIGQPDGEEEQMMKKIPAGESHSFFKPRTSAKSATSTENQPSIPKQILHKASFPDRYTMHVVPARDLPGHHVPHGPTSATTAPRASKGHTEPLVAKADDWDSTDWQQMSTLLLQRSRIQPSIEKQIKPTPAIQNLNLPKLEFTEHAALRSLANSKLHANLIPTTDENSLWTTKYAPRSAAEVLQPGNQAIILRDWLKSRSIRNKDRLQFTTAVKKDVLLNRYNPEGDDFVVDDEIEDVLTSDIGAEMDSEPQTACPPGRETLFRSHLIVLTGPTGCGKSAAVQAVAKELAFEIFEVNSTDRRSGKDVVERVGEASQSQMVNKQRAADGSRSRSLILFEEVDVLYRDDKDFWPAVSTLATFSKRPIVLTCNDVSLLPRQLDNPSIVLEFVAPQMALATNYLQALLDVEGITTSKDEITRQLISNSLDLRSTINALQFISLKDQQECNLAVDSVISELMSMHRPVSVLYRSCLPGAMQEAISRELLRKYSKVSDDLSYVDNIASQQRSCAFEACEVYENDLEEDFSRGAEKDDLVGLQIISEPYGRFTRLHPGDLDVATSYAFMVQAALPNELTSKVPFWIIPRASHVIEDRVPELSTSSNWTSMIDASTPFSEPENWMYDYAPHSCIERPRVSGILATDVMPYLRYMTCADDRRDAWEKACMEAYSGRTTRNTMSNEYGFKRKSKIPQAFRAAISATGLHYATQ